MDIIAFGIGGFIGGFVFAAIIDIFERRKKICGTIEVDHKNNLTRFHIGSNELSNRKTKKVIFTVQHDVNISRDEQSL